MDRKPTLNELNPLTAAVISRMSSGEELADSQCRGLRVRCSKTGQKVFLYRYRGKDGALRQIRLGAFGALTLAKAREAVARRRQERDEGRDPQLEKRKQRVKARQERSLVRRATY